MCRIQANGAAKDNFAIKIERKYRIWLRAMGLVYAAARGPRPVGKRALSAVVFLTICAVDYLCLRSDSAVSEKLLYIFWKNPRLFQPIGSIWEF